MSQKITSTYRLGRGAFKVPDNNEHLIVDIFVELLWTLRESTLRVVLQNRHKCVIFNEEFA